MKMSQCVPNWDLEASTTHPHYSNVPSMDYEVAELTWENGQLSMHGLYPPRLPTKPAAEDDDEAGAGTLESLVNQATTTCHAPAPNDLPPWFDHSRRPPSVSMDALVPCNNNHAPRGCNTNVSVTESTPAPFDGGVAGSTSLWSPENTSSGKDYTTKTNSGDDHDSVSHSRSQRECGEDDEVGKKKLKSSLSTKRSRAAAIHNQSERKRRDKINQRLKTLQKLVPNSSKTDKASILDEVIEYVKQLQAQVHTMNRMNIPQMMLPLQALHHQQLHMSMMAAAAAAAAAQQPHHMPMPVMDFNSLNRAAAVMSPPMMAAAAAAAPPPLMPLTGSWDMQGDCTDILSAFLAGQLSQPQQSLTMDAYSRLVAMFQQFQQGSGPSPKN